MLSRKSEKEIKTWNFTDFIQPIPMLLVTQRVQRGQNGSHSILWSWRSDQKREGDIRSLIPSKAPAGSTIGLGESMPAKLQVQTWKTPCQASELDTGDRIQQKSPSPGPSHTEECLPRPLATLPMLSCHLTFTFPPPVPRTSLEVSKRQHRPPRWHFLLIKCH